MLHVLYLAHDLNDPAVRRRILMLKAGGAEVTVAGFARKANPFAEVEGIVPIDLGRTFDGRFIQRLATIGRAALSLSVKLAGNPRPDVIIGRNLEMLALAHRAGTLMGGDIPIVYECLDIHRLMLRNDLAGQALRAIEGRLCRKSALLMTSSPAFLKQYFERYGQVDLPAVLVENKVLELDQTAGICASARPAPSPGQPWRVGWFGALRCRRSLALLADLARRMDGRVEIVLRGRPAYDQFVDFDRQVQDAPFMNFAGPYRNPEDLADIYGGVHFSWLLDFFEEGMNSNWLLPNRLYEGCRHATVPIALAGTETAGFLRDRGIGLILEDPSPDALHDLMEEAICADRYAEAAAGVAARDLSCWRVGRSDCAELVARLEQVRPISRLAA